MMLSKSWEIILSQNHLKFGEKEFREEKQNIWHLRLQIDLNLLIKEDYKFWRMYQVKYALFAKDHLVGAKNGKIVGRKLNIVQIDAEIGKH